jgi:hypothetical protein
MRRSVFVAAVAALLGLAGTSRAFHPCLFHHHHHHHARGSGAGSLSVAPLSVAPLSVAPLSVAPLTVAPLSVAPLSVAPLSVSPFAVAPFSVTPLSVVPLTANNTASAEAFNAATVLTGLRAACRLLNSTDGVGGGVGGGGGDGATASDLNALRNQVAAQKDLLDLILADVNERRAAEKKPELKAPAAPINNPKIKRTTSTTPAASPTLAAIDARLAEMSAADARLAELRAAAVRANAAAGAGAPGLARRD